LRKDHRSESGGHSSKATNEASRHGKDALPGLVSKDSNSVARSMQPPTAVTPSKDERAYTFDMSKRANNTASSYQGGLQKDHRFESGGRSSKATNEASCHGKYESPGLVSNDSNSVAWSMQPPMAVTPSKDERAFSRHKTKTVPPILVLRKTPLDAIDESKNDRTSKSSCKTQPEAVNDLRQIVTTFPMSTLSCIAIDWLSPSITRAEVRKYLPDEESVPKSTKDQLEFLMDKFPLHELKSAYYMTVGEMGADVNSVNLPFNARMDSVIKSFITMIYNHRSMMYDDSRSGHR
jgi:hypothetical protein